MKVVYADTRRKGHKPKATVNYPNFGVVLIVIGVIWGFIAFSMNTSIETESKTIGVGIYSTYIPSQTVHNLALADQRRNHLIGAGITLVSGVLLFGFGTLQPKKETEKAVTAPERKCPFCAELRLFNVSSGLSI